MITKVNFSMALKIELLKRGKTIKEFANEIKMSEIGLHNAIKKNSTKIETLVKISNALNVDIKTFFKTEI